ncbi:MAG: response regulator [Candidatus Hydrothermarchaeales archaeon]
MSKILIVDDEPDVADLLATVLKKEGYEVKECHSGREALEEIDKEKPDLVLLDVMMPELDGWEVCKRLKESEKTKDLLVAMLTVKSSYKDMVKSLKDAGANWHISKPIRRDEFVKTVGWLLSKGRASK